MNIFIKLSILSVFLFFSSYNFANESEGIEFKYTKQELAEMDKWKNKSADDLWDDAMQCERGALHLFGMGFLMGSMGLSVDVDKADLLFAKSASFGFAPSIKQLVHRHFEKENVALAMVYCNLLISCGHKEYVPFYFDTRQKMLNMGEGVCREIERLASEKYGLILENVENVKKEQNKKEFFIRMYIDGTDITSQDVLFDDHYWVRFSKFQVEAEKAAKKLDYALQNDFMAVDELYRQSQKNFSIAIDLFEKKENFHQNKVEFLKSARASINKTEEFIQSMDELQNCPSANPHLVKLARELTLLCKNVKGVVEQHYSFFVNPDQWFESDVEVDKLLEYTAGVDCHGENIQKMFKELSTNKT